MAQTVKKVIAEVAEVGDKLLSVVDVEVGRKHTHDIEGSFKKEEVQLAFRNHGGFIEGLERDITPVGQHYILQHFDVPLVTDLASYRYSSTGGWFGG